VATKRTKKVPRKSAMEKWAIAIPNTELDKLQTTADLLGKSSASLARELIAAFNNGQIKLPLNPHMKEVYK